MILRNWLLHIIRRAKNPLAESDCLILLPVLHTGLSPERLQRDIQLLQRILSERGFSTRVSGRFDITTEKAVRGFQEANGLRVDGVVGTLTWAALRFKTLSRRQVSPSNPADREFVKYLQDRLIEEDFPTNNDGCFTAQTEEYLKKFQSLNGLFPDGVCGPQTWSVLLGQRQKIELSEYRRMRRILLTDYSLKIAAILLGMYINPFGIEHQLSNIGNPVVAYVIAYFSPSLLDKLPVNISKLQTIAVLRYAPFILMGFMWNHILQALSPN